MRSNSHFYTFSLRVVNVMKKSFLHSFAEDSKCDQINVFGIFVEDSKCDQIIILRIFAGIVNVIK